MTLFFSSNCRAIRCLWHLSETMCWMSAIHNNVRRLTWANTCIALYVYVHMRLYGTPTQMSSNTIHTHVLCINYRSVEIVGSSENERCMYYKANRIAAVASTIVCCMWMLTVNRYIFNSVSVQEETHRIPDITYLSCLEHTTTTAAAPVAAAAAAVETRQSEKRTN